MEQFPNPFERVGGCFKFTVFDKGFTLVEILIVLAIISVVMSLGLVSVQQVTNQQVSSTTRKFVGLVRTLRNDSILLNNVYRLVFNLDNGSYWVEVQKQFKLLSDEDRKAKVTKSNNKTTEYVMNANFEFAPKYSKEPVPLPGGVTVLGALKEQGGFAKSGIVFIHFFPNGFNDHSILYLAKEGAEEPAYSLILRPVGGKVEVINRKVENFE